LCRTTRFAESRWKSARRSANNKLSPRIAIRLALVQ
jgi:hypothetical protein